MENKKYNFDDIDFDDLEFDDIEDEFSYLEEFDDLTSPAEQPTMAAHRATVYPRTPVTERAPSRPPVYTPVPTAEPTPVTSEPVSTLEPVSSAATKMMHLIFVIIFFVITVIPVFGMIFNLGGENAENRNMAKMPALFVSSSDASTVLNEKFPAQFEEYISDNFGFRQEIISLWSAAQYFVFNESAVEDVIVGENDWLFYTSTKADYEGTNLYTDRTIFRLAKTVELMDRYVTDSGAVFAFTVAPNKATVYPEYMSP